MKNPGLNRLLKLLTISCFVILITGFVTYKSGVFDKGENTPQYGLMVESRDSPERRNLIMSSSKSSIAFEPDRLERIRQRDDDYTFNTETISDSNEIPIVESKSLKRDFKNALFNPNKELMSSSKSIQLFKPDQSLIMASSKSMIVVDPLFSIPSFYLDLKPDTLKDSVRSIIRNK
jgi:hypothetical protein